MARKPRKLVDSETYHIILRGNDRQDIFIEDEDREFFVNRILKYAEESGIKLYAYCLMDNHVHILLGNGNKNMALFVKKIACSYVYYFNHKYDRTGHLFQGRYKSEPIESIEHLKTVYRYIIKNPEKIGTDSFYSYKWNSYHKEKKSGIIQSDFIKSVFGSEKKKKFFLHQKNSDVCMEDYPCENQSGNDDNLKIIFVKQLFSLDNILSISKENSYSRRRKIQILKECGLSVNQISRITGINRYFIRLA